MFKNGFIVIAMVFVLITGWAVASWDTVPQPRPAQDMIDVLVTVPKATLDQFGYTERTRVIYTIAKILEALNLQATRIQTLEKQVAELTKPVDPNTVKE